MVVLSECGSKPLLNDRTNDSCHLPEPNETEDDYTNDEDDDALSLCDLPIYSSSGSNSFSSLNRCEYQEEANSDFDFFSGELGAVNRTILENNDAIVFCGKLIGCKDVVDQNPSVKAKKQVVLFSWKRFKIPSFRKSASKKKAIDSSRSAPSKDKCKLLRSTESDSLEKMSSAKKGSTLLTCPTKSRWYLFMFGQTRFPQAMTMDLGDLKNRQQRRLCSPSPSMKLRATEGGGGSGSGRGRGRGIWSLLKESVTTSVGKTNADDVVRAVGCISLV